MEKRKGGKKERGKGKGGKDRWRELEQKEIRKWKEGKKKTQLEK
jgi:hypothetical protein